MSEPQRPLVQPPPEAEAEAWHKTLGWRPPGPRTQCEKRLPKRVAKVGNPLALDTGLSTKKVIGGLSGPFGPG
ncbi:hypothetical protein K435DRAFT_513476 [Dendrothele bispora CBS 962.96]|uniref:Uncharacterized protein n=1 Tax=Dendrothele bispora (strain CBS 962.96) TaxID=1314807 RepID=A0A4S8M993_DENBC|nr:hypothetical protein K435DRAFT_513476 [Dendrothele bispora CBS 962.96]